MSEQNGCYFCKGHLFLQRTFFKCIVLGENLSILIWLLLKFVSRGPFTNTNSVLSQIIFNPNVDK